MSKNSGNLYSEDMKPTKEQQEYLDSLKGEELIEKVGRMIANELNLMVDDTAIQQTKLDHFMMTRNLLKRNVQNAQGRFLSVQDKY